MPGVPIFHLSHRSSSPKPPPILPPPASEPISVLIIEPTPPTPTTKAKPPKSILKKMSITWNEPKHHNKLHKPPPGHRNTVHYTPPPDTPLILAPDVLVPSTPVAIPPTPETSPEGDGHKVKRKSSFISRLLPSRQPQNPHTPAQPMPMALPPSPPAETWQHHTSYFPEYEPIHPTSTPTISSNAARTYFPEYTPLRTPSHPLNQYPGLSGAFAYALTPAESAALGHQSRVGQAAVVHYPNLPQFSEYTTVTAPAGKGGKIAWTSGQWGHAGWNGVSWDADKAGTDGLSFATPMPVGENLPPPEEEGKKKGKGKGKNKGKGGGGGDGGGGGGGDGGDGGDDADGGDAD